MEINFFLRALYAIGCLTAFMFGLRGLSWLSDQSDLHHLLNEQGQAAITFANNGAPLQVLKLRVWLIFRRSLALKVIKEVNDGLTLKGAYRRAKLFP